MLTVQAARTRLRRIDVPLFDPLPYQQKLQQTAVEFGFTISPCRHAWQSVAYLGRQEMFCPWPPKNEEDVASGAHEAGHLLQPKCSKRDPHFRNNGILDRGCIACEVSAWAFGIALLRPLRWTRPMHDTLVMALRSYRGMRAWPEATAQLDALSRTLTFYSIKQSQLEQEIHQ